METGEDRAVILAFDDYVAMVQRTLFADGFLLTADVDEAHDLVQEVLLRAWRSWAQLQEHGDRVAWSRRVLRNLVIGNWRRRQVARRYLTSQSVAHELPVDEQYLHLVTALRRLPLEHRRAVVLHHVDGLPIEEVALLLGAPIGTVKSWCSRGRAELAKALEVDDRPRLPHGALPSDHHQPNGGEPDE